MVRLKGFIIIPPEELELIEKELAIHADLSRKEPGCITFQATKSETNPQQYNIYEEFIDQPAFDFHQDRVKNSRWGAVSKSVKRYYEMS